MPRWRTTARVSWVRRVLVAAGNVLQPQMTNHQVRAVKAMDESPTVSELESLTTENGKRAQQIPDGEEDGIQLMHTITGLFGRLSRPLLV